MADVFDEAQRCEEATRAAALIRFHGSTPRAEGRDDCEDCGHTIPKKRRRALPHATRCIGCQRLFERLR
jgi:phage/conjugal plasmid C-4 type zinc finger TraR family protein